jgi:Tol biopolymer transport system component
MMSRALGIAEGARARQRLLTVLGVTALAVILVAPSPWAKRSFAHAVDPGATFVFQRSSVNFQLYEEGLNGGNPRQITFAGSNPPLFAEHPAVSPDRTQLAYIVSDAGVGSGKDGLYVSALDGSGAHRIPVTYQGGDIGADAFGDEAPTWSPDGSMIILSRGIASTTKQLFVVSSSGGAAQLISPDPSISDDHPRWSSAGLAFDRRISGRPTEVWTATVAGAIPGGVSLSRMIQVTNDTSGADIEPTWSPDGQQIAFARTNGNGTSHDGSSARIAKVTLGAGGPAGPTQLLSSRGGFDEYPAWSPDGQLIAFDRLGFGKGGAPDPFNTGTLETLSADGGSQHALPSPPDTFSQAPDWLRAPQPPVLGKMVDVGPASGIVLVKKPGQTGFQRLRASARIPVGSTVDTTHGRVRLTSAANNHGAIQTANFHDGAFVVGQRGGQALTTVRLTGGDFRSCGRRSGDAGPGARIARHRPRRHLWGSGTGSFSTTGNSAAAAVRGTIWLTEDDCEGTLIRVQRGTVTVTDLVRHKTIIVSAPGNYFAPR